MSGLVDYGPLLNPRPEPSPSLMRAIDTSAWALPVVAALLSVGAGLAALLHADAWAAWLGIGGGVISSLGVLATGWASQVRDRRLAEARNLGALGVDMVDLVARQHPGNF